MRLLLHQLPLLLMFIMTGAGIVGCNIGRVEDAAIAPQPDTPQQTTPCRDVQHEAGVTSICDYPERVVALDPHAMDLLLSLGVQPIGYAEVDVALVRPFSVGTEMTEIKYLGDRITAPPAYIGSRNQPSLEAILKLQPDLIVGEGASRFNYETLARLAPTLLLKGVEADQWQQNIQTLAQAFDAEETAQAVITAHNQTLETVRTAIAPTVAQKQGLLLATDGSSFTVFHDQQDYAGSLLRDVGITLIDVEDTSYASLSVEILPELEADFIIVMAASDNTVEAEQRRWQQSPVLRSLPAYQNNQVYFVDYQLWSRIRGPIAAELILEEVQNLLN